MPQIHARQACTGATLHDSAERGGADLSSDREASKPSTQTRADMKKILLIPMLGALLLLAACADHLPFGPPEGGHRPDSLHPQVAVVANLDAALKEAERDAERQKLQGGNPAHLGRDITPLVVSPPVLDIHFASEQAAVEITWTLQKGGRYEFRQDSITVPGLQGGPDALFSCAPGAKEAEGRASSTFTCKVQYKGSLGFKYTIRVYDREHPDAPPITLDPGGHVTGP